MRFSLRLVSLVYLQLLAGLTGLYLNPTNVGVAAPTAATTRAHSDGSPVRRWRTGRT